MLFIFLNSFAAFMELEKLGKAHLVKEYIASDSKTGTNKIEIIFLNFMYWVMLSGNSFCWGITVIDLRLLE